MNESPFSLYSMCNMGFIFLTKITNSCDAARLLGFMWTLCLSFQSIRLFQKMLKYCTKNNLQTNWQKCRNSFSGAGKRDSREGTKEVVWGVNKGQQQFLHYSVMIHHWHFNLYKTELNFKKNEGKKKKAPKSSAAQMPFRPRF